MDPRQAAKRITPLHRIFFGLAAVLVLFVALAACAPTDHADKLWLMVPPDAR